MKRNITAKVVVDKDDYLDGFRENIAKLNGILDRFATEEGFDAYVEADSIRIGVGDDEVDLYFSPSTWEAAERFIMFSICHLIESDELDELPYYREMADRYAAALGIERGSFE